MAESTEPSTRRRGRLSTRLVALVLLVTVPLAALSILSALNDRREAADRAHERTAEIASIGALVVDGIVQQTNSTLEVVGQLSNARGPRCTAELAAAKGEASIYTNIYSVEDDGTVACAARGDVVITDVSGTEWFQKTEATRDLTVTVPAQAIAAGPEADLDAPTMIVGRARPRPLELDELPEVNIPEEQSGIFAATLDPQVMVAFVDPFEPSGDTVVQVVNGSGQIVARNLDWTEYYGMESPGFARMEGNERGTLDGKGVDGVYRLYSYQRVLIGGESLYVMAGFSRADAFSAADTHLVWSLVIILLLGLAVGVLALAAGRSLVARPVERLRSAISGFRAGDVTRRAGEIGGPAEVVELGESFDAMADELQHRLENQQRLLDQLEEASEAERQSIAAGIHDEVLQTLSAMGIRVQLMRRSANEEQQVELDRLREMLDTTAAQLRGLLFDLRPPAFDRIGIAATLRETIEVRLGLDLDDWSVTGEPGPDVPEHVQILLYRIAQQALANIREHAGAHRVDVRFATTGSVVTMEITDDGRGFDVSRIESESRPGHIGLQVMRDRARGVGGEVTITSEDGLGTTVRADIPYRAAGDGGATADQPDQPDPAASI